jgi:hypothetical protein
MKTEIEKQIELLQAEISNLTDELMLSLSKWYNTQYSGKIPGNITRETLIIKREIEKRIESAKYTNSLFKTMGASAYALASKGAETANGSLIVGQKEFSDHFFNKPYKGRALSQRLNSNATKLRREITQITREALMNKTTYRDLKKKFLATTASDRAKLPKVYRQLEKTIQNVGIESDEVKTLLKKAKQQSKKLKISDSELGDLRKSYEGVQKAIEKKDTKLFEAKLKKAKQKKLESNALRLSRTELQRAYDEAQMRAMYENEEVWGYKVELSPNHPKPDICDVYANIDFGYGQGVFPKSKMIEVPIHPNCICRKYAIYAKPKGRRFTYNNTKVKEWLKKQPKRKREDILGVNAEKNQNKWDAALLKKNIIAPKSTREQLGLPKKYVKINKTSREGRKS